MPKAIFLDRDGVINRAIVLDGKPYPPCNLKSLEILPGVKKSMLALKEAGWLLIVVSNQPDVARGKVQISVVEAINKYLCQQLPITDIRTCYHDDSDKCSCRKPSPGLILDASLDYNIDLLGSFMVGDRWRDIEAGARAGCQTIFIDYDYAEKQPIGFTHRVKSLTEAADIILGI